MIINVALFNCFHFAGSAPKTVKIFANQDNAGFEDLESLAPLQEFTLDHDQLASPLQLKFVKFQNVNSFSVRILLYYLYTLYFVNIFHLSKLTLVVDFCCR